MTETATGKMASYPIRPEGMLSVRLPNRTEALAQLSDLIGRFSDFHKLGQATCFALNVAIDELVANVIFYAFPEGVDGMIEVRLFLGKESMVIEIEDPGTPFNPLEKETPDTEAPMEDREIGGLGIHIVKHLMDEVEYQRIDGRNLLRLRKGHEE